MRVLILLLVSVSCFGQANTALINTVKYNNGDSYIDPSIPYAGTGFLMESDKGTFAITAKHVLWIARNKNSKSVEVNKDLKRWVMRSKDNKDSVVVDQLINEDANEVLEGPVSTILERDWLVFSVKSSTAGIQKLRPRKTEIKNGEQVFIIGNPYGEINTKKVESHVVRKLGMDIIIESPDGAIAGLSGSPVVDSNGSVIGVFSHMSSDAITKKNVCVIISTEYFQKVLSGREGLNDPKKDYGELILQTIMRSNTKKAIDQYKELAADPQNYYIYNLRSANRNGLAETGDKLVEMKKYKEAIDILQFNLSINDTYFQNYNKLASAWLLSGSKTEAIKYYRLSVEKMNDPEENEAFKELEKLGVKN